MTNGPIVVPLDGSKNAEMAIPFALRLSDIYGLELRFVHVLHGEQAKGEGALEKATEIFRDYVEGLLESRGKSDVPHRADVITGPPAAEIIKYAEDAAFITIATHGRGGMKATFIGSVADKVVRGARVPLVLVPLAPDPRPVGEGPILVALDGSEEGERGLPLARELAAKRDAKVILIRAFNLPPAMGVEFAPYPADLLITLQADAEEYLRQTAKAGETAVCVQSTAAEGIAQAAEQFDAGLVVVAAHGRGFAARLALGSTTDRLMHMIKRPMLIVHMKREEASR
ncbi:MAG: universal stress protein [Dehalococcoidia bacterium]|nr:universal stress protein [Dehalococcoidia bacterium]